MRKYKVFVGGLLALGVGVAVAEDQLAPVEVEDTFPPLDSSQFEAATEELEIGLPSDAAEALRSVNGVSGSRMGGRGMDPIIRGQSETRLNVLLDGAYVHGGCPNRMDPPTAYADLSGYDSVTVLKGFQSVLHGGGGSGGTVLLERETPRLDADKRYRGRINAGYRGNSDTVNLGADLTLGGPQGYARGILGYQDADNYEDGDGNEVRSAYETKSGALILGYTPDDDTLLEASYDGVRDRDVLFAGAGMDSPKSDNDTYKLKFSKQAMDGALSGIRAEIYRSNIDHEMDNYSLRQLVAPMKMWVPSESDTTGGRLIGETSFGGNLLWSFGIDYQRNERDANRYAGPRSGGKPSNLQSVLWPGADIKQPGLLAEVTAPLGGGNRIKGGLRYDRVSAEVNRADQQTMNIAGASSANDLYRQYYGAEAKDQTEHNVGGFLRYEHPVGPGDSQVFASLARTVRTADATERYLAANAGPAPNGTFPMRWVGNPFLDPEKHYQAELGLSWDGGPWQLGSSVFYDHVDDYILRDRAHGQSGILRDDNASIYRNVKARLWGIEAEGNLRWASNWSSQVQLAYVEARNTSDDSWIAQTPPLEGSVSVDYARSEWQVGARLRFAAKQTKVDDNINTGSGLDAEKTPGWTALDLYGDWQLSRHAKLDVGISNVFDQTFAYHVNRANSDPFNPNAVQVNEPGREIWAKLSARF